MNGLSGALGLNPSSVQRSAGFWTYYLLKFTLMVVPMDYDLERQDYLYGSPGGYRLTALRWRRH